MSNIRRRDAWKEHHWRQVIREWRASGLSARAFCARRGLSEPSFYGWRRELQRRDAQAPAFVPVQVVPDDAPVPGVLEVVVRGGRSIRIPPGFDAATLRQVLAVLEEKPSC